MNSKLNPKNYIWFPPASYLAQPVKGEHDSVRYGAWSLAHTEGLRTGVSIATHTILAGLKKKVLILEALYLGPEQIDEMKAIGEIRISTIRELIKFYEKEMTDAE